MSRSRRHTAALRLSLLLLVLALTGLVAPPAQAAAPGNDAFATPTALTLGAAPITGTTVDATVQAGEPNDQWGGAPHHTVWYRWVAPSDFGSGTVVVTALPSGRGVTPEIAVFTGSTNDVSGLTRVSEYETTTSFKVSAGATYSIRIDSYANTSPGTFALSLQRGGTVHALASVGGVRLQNLCLTLDPSATGDGVGFVYTNGDWDYELTAPVGAHSVLIQNCDHGNEPENVAPVVVPIQVNADQTTTIDRALAPGGTITGTVTPATGSNVQNACVEAQTAWQENVMACPDASGHYVLNSLGTASYRVVFNGALGYNNATTEAQLAPLPIKAGCVTTLNANLATNTTTLVGRDCSQTPACKAATAAASHAAAVVKKDAKKLKKAKKKHKKAHGTAKRKLAKKVKKLHKMVKKAKKASARAASAKNTACH